MSAMTIAPGRIAAGTTAGPTGGAGRAAPGRPSARVARTTAAEAPLRLTARGRLVVWLLALTLAVASGVGGAALSARADGPRGGTEVERVVVAPGETLWGLAAAVAGPGDDVRDVVLQLMELNELPAGGLQAGQTVVVPAR
ncbi:LysM peptidoglycan-binding domain-containing protein [Cellulomonas shaoxiangyii]|uniref:LysM peptidoglycan-binding domain-containing protein n=1 Tax=Cellulomonas shaoxiangyii TaxID=2566013 RepID=A0A4V1CMS0_9CELL|nr:LysM peptidoglycan-binding domain-containing protein [Cellulomonas shaoxiangyii]QCB93915.1 LysM peptidoglycan-binding domain-containing protein [Cellulomonas shaoxiangyii]TGY85988.1 LysM peptidoglycan-binding domain-containing protein [Cellulomonas shaoxiangyii]